MPGNAYFVPTEEASLTATAGRTLQGLGCNACGGRSMSWYMPGILSPSQLAGFGDRLPPALGAAYSYPVERGDRAGLGRLGAGAGSGRFNRSVARGVYELPFVSFPGQGARGLGQDFAADPVLLLLGLGLFGLSVVLFGAKTRRRRYRRRKLGAL